MVHRVVHTAGFKRSPFCFAVVRQLYSLCPISCAFRARNSWFPLPPAARHQYYQLVAFWPPRISGSSLQPVESVFILYKRLRSWSCSPKDNDFSQSERLPNSSTDDHALSNLEISAAALQLDVSYPPLLWQEQPCSLNAFVQYII